eukprot:Seg1739.7 transcript_id=Seg1739.7/GoldUCD/mRNA.D3Y31 product="hypothetical protein" protein_id=Seg1739.7/GoldUCD/D3Y31
MAGQENIFWLSQEHTISEVLDHHKLPVVVKVVEGSMISEEDCLEADTVLTVHGEHTVEKAIIYDQCSRPYSIPLNCKYKAKMLPFDRSKIFDTVESIFTAAYLPRFIKSLEGIDAFGVSFPKDTIFEIGTICRDPTGKIMGLSVVSLGPHAVRMMLHGEVKGPFVEIIPPCEEGKLFPIKELKDRKFPIFIEFQHNIGDSNAIEGLPFGMVRLEKFKKCPIVYAINVIENTRYLITFTRNLDSTLRIGQVAVFDNENGEDDDYSMIVEPEKELIDLKMVRWLLECYPFPGEFIFKSFEELEAIARQTRLHNKAIDDDSSDDDIDEYFEYINVRNLAKMEVGHRVETKPPRLELGDSNDDSDYEIPVPRSPKQAYDAPAPRVQAPKPPKDDYEIQATTSADNIYDLPAPKSHKNACDVFPAPKSSKNVYTPDPTTSADDQNIAIPFKEENTIGDEHNEESSGDSISTKSITKPNKPGYPPKIPKHRLPQVPKPASRKSTPKSEKSPRKGSLDSDLARPQSVNLTSPQPPPLVPKRDYNFKRSALLPFGCPKQHQSVSKKQPPPIAPRRNTQSKPEPTIYSEQPSVSERDTTENVSLIVCETEGGKIDEARSQTVKAKECVPPPIPPKRKPSQRTTNRPGLEKSAIYSVPRQTDSVPDTHNERQLGSKESPVGAEGRQGEVKTSSEVDQVSLIQVSLDHVSLEDKEDSVVNETSTGKESISDVLQVIALNKYEVEMTTNQVDLNLLLDLAEEDLMSEIGMTRFEARKLLLFVQNRWRPDGCAVTGTVVGAKEEAGQVVEAEKWTCEVVSVKMAEEIKLTDFARFCIENQINGKLLINILDKNMLQSIREDYGVSLSKIAEAKLNGFVFKGWRPTSSSAKGNSRE